MVPFDQIFYWNSGVNFADPGDPNDVILGSFQGNSMGSLSSSDPEAATYTNLGVAGYGLPSSTAGGQAYANKWNAIQYKFNGFHKGDPLTASLGNKAFNGIKIRLKFKISSSATSGSEPNLRDIQMMHITIKQNDAVLRPEDDPNYGTGRGSDDQRYTWGFVKVTPDSASNYVTVNGGWHTFVDDYLDPSDIPNNSSSWNSNPRKFTFANDYTEAPLFQGNDIHDGNSFLPFFESISDTSLNAFPQHTQGIRPMAPSEYSWFASYPTPIIIGTLALSKEVSGFGFDTFPLNGNNFNYSNHLYTTARYLLTNDDEPTGNSGSFTIWESNKVIPPGAEFKVTFARDIADATSAMDGTTEYYRPSLPYDCRLELIPKN